MLFNHDTFYLGLAEAGKKTKNRVHTTCDCIPSIARGSRQRDRAVTKNAHRDNAQRLRKISRYVNKGE